jgi:PPOX class probable F420-dependent enzyme
MATVAPDGAPHLVAHTFATEGDWIFHAVDWKPKSTASLLRIANIRANPRVSVLADHYSDSWEELWWARADGEALVWERDQDRAGPVRLLVARYGQYRERPPEGPVIAVQVRRWSGWAYSG